jgi:hypothetical protein
MIGAITFVVALIYVPQCKVQIYADNTTSISLGLAAVVAFFVYHSK